MFFLLSKILSLLLKPFTWLLLLLIGGLIRPASKRIRWLWAALILALFFSNDAVLYYTAGWYEASPRSVDSLAQTYDYGVLLSGTGSYSEKHQAFFFSEASDRFIQAVHLYQQGMINKILITGGSGKILDQEHKEAVYLKSLMRKYKIPEQDILIDTQARNTYENAKNTATMLKEYPNAQILLITSALHFRRAQACFHKQGLYPDAFPVDVIIRAPEQNPDYWLVPSAEILTKWEAVLHEWMGTIAYKGMGYI